MKRTIILTFFSIFVLQQGCHKRTIRSPQVKIEDVLFGSTGSCVSNNQCIGGVCRFNTCIGYLIAQSFLDRDIIGRRIKTLIANKKINSKKLLLSLISFFQQQKSDIFVRGRTAQLIGLICKGKECSVLSECVKHNKDPLRFYCAIGLATSGQNTEVLKGYTRFIDPVGKLAEYFLHEKD